MALATSRVSSPPTAMVPAASKGGSLVSSRELRAKRRLSYSGSLPITATRRKVSIPDSTSSSNYYSSGNTSGNTGYYSHIHNSQEATPPETNGDSPSPSPGPEDLGCSAGVTKTVLAPVSANTRSKSVTFDIANNKEYEASPLLTPKYDDEDDDYGHFAEPQPDISTENDNEINDGTAPLDDLNRNHDYSALCSTLDMLHSKESQIHSEMTQLSNLKSAVQHMNKASLMDFYLRLLQGHVHLPEPSKIPKAPVVQWGKYGLSDKVGDCLKGTLAVKEPMELGLKVFNSKSRNTSPSGEIPFEDFKY